MHFLSLSVQNFGIYRGSHEFALAPVEVPGRAPRHVTVVCGHNGAGKSTLFQALGVALHGPLALGDRVTRQAYSDFLLASLHRFRRDGSKEVSAEGSVAVTFLYVQGGRPKRIRVERRWTRGRSSVRETLSVFEDGRAPEVSADDYQSWINDLVPPSVAPVCFFDAEQLSEFSSPEIQTGLLSQTLRRVLGLDVVERLEADLDAYVVRTSGSLKISSVREQVLKHQKAVDDIDKLIEEREKLADEVRNRRGALLRRLEQKERELAAEGGSYAARRPRLKDRLAALDREIGAVTREIQDLAGDLLPFALAPSLARSLSARLDAEAESRRRVVASELWRARVSALGESLGQDVLWQGLKISARARTALVDRLRALIGADEEEVEPRRFTHGLSEDEQRRVQNWISRSLDEVPVKVQSLGERLRELERERQAVNDDLERSPDDGRLASLHAELTELRDQVRTLEKDEEAPLLAELASLRVRRSDAARERQRSHDQLVLLQEADARVSLANQSRLALRAYRDAVTRERTAQLEVELVLAFNALCRKGHLLGKAHIDPVDGQVVLESADGHPVSLADFSAGERQLYALALLRALRTVSCRQLPLAVDTPVARLDETHRGRLLTEYFPSASGQVLLFATDVELDESLLRELEPHLARLYRLRFDPTYESTLVARERAGEDDRAQVAALDATVV